MIRGFFYHLQLTLRLNFKSRQPLIYGYLVPVFFLVAFGTVFRGGLPPLLRQMSQLVTISALGGACFGMPTALVAERERGWWRRYRLLPRAMPALLASTLLARLMLIATAALLQIVLARLIYGTPWPLHPAHFIVAYLAAAAAFLGLGLLIAALATDVPSVQALGQCVFLPLIMVGGVGIPLLALPPWTQRLASFLPGRYAVDALQTGYTTEGHGAVFRFNLLALAAFALAAGLAGARLFRWDPAQSIGRRARGWLGLALVPWAVVGALALRSGHWHALDAPAGEAAAAITDAQMDSIRFEGLPPDEGEVTPLARPVQRISPEQRARLDEFRARLDAWGPGRNPDYAQAIRDLLSVASVADVAQDPQEGAMARLVLDYLYAHYRQDRLEKGLAWSILDPGAGSVRTALPELGLAGGFDEGIIRTRNAIYAAKFLGRVRGQLPN